MDCLRNKIAGSAAGYVLVATFLLGFTSCGGGGGGASGAPGSPSTAVSNSTEYSSGSLGVFLSSGNATVAVPTASYSTGSSGNSSSVTPSNTAYLITLPNPQNSPSIQCPNMSAIGGINLDSQHSVGVAFDTASYTLGFFTFTAGSPPSVSTCDSFLLSSSSSSIVTSAGSTSVGGVVMDPSIQTAIVETGYGFQFVDYSNSSNPAISSVYPRIPPYSSSSSGGIDLVENFAYDPYLVVGGVSYKMILSGSGAVSYYKGDSDGNLLELADIKTGTIYRPDPQTKTFFPTGQFNGCSADAIGIDTAYQVAIIGCEYDGLQSSSPSTPSLITVLVNLNAMILNSLSRTYSLPQSAISSVTLTPNAPPQNNIFVDSVNHIVMWGSGGDWGSSNANNFSVAKLSDPFTSFGNGIVGGAAKLSSLQLGWVGYGYPHGSAMYVDSSGNSVALWMNQSAQSLAMVKANEILAGNTSTAVTYVTIP